MSSTKIILLTIICIMILAVPLAVIYVFNPALLGRYVGLTENVIAGIVAGLVITLLLDLVLRRRQEIAIEKVARIGLSETSVQINRIFQLFGSMIKASSTGLIPTKIDDLFNGEAAKLISLHLDLNKSAPVMPEVNWSNYVSSWASLFMNELAQIQNRYQAYFSERTLTSIAALRNNHLLEVFQYISQMSSSDKKLNIQRPVLNIPIDVLTPLMAEILFSIKQIQKDAIKLKSSVIPRFPRRGFDNDVRPKFGEARYDGTPGPPFFIGNELPRISPPQS